MFTKEISIEYLPNCYFFFFLQKSSPRKRSVNAPFEDGSDESETSSICSEKSTDFVRRTSDVSKKKNHNLKKKNQYFNLFFSL